MDKNKRDLESLCVSQKEQLARYETRLKDVVAAYKGLLKEKEALEASLSALTINKEKTIEENGNSTVSFDSSADGVAKKSVPSSSEEAAASLQLQLGTLMNSLATLSAEKSRMEASFQADKKQIRNELSYKDKQIRELNEKIKEIKEQSAVDLENMKSKVIVERHERDKESNNHMVMIRELQKILADERHLKDNLEMQLNDLKSQITAEHGTITSDHKIKNLKTELQQTKEKMKQYEAENSKVRGTDEEVNNNSKFLHQLQDEMQHLKQQHAIAIKTEQKRALVAEERNKKLAALHEDRVANLESRLAELSHTVGTYDRLRQQDQENIQKLKDKIIQLGANNSIESLTVTDLPTKSVESKRKDLTKIIEEITELKKILLIENARSDSPIDLNKIFNTGADHTQCFDDLGKIEADLIKSNGENHELKHTIETQKHHIKILQEKVIVLNRNIDEQELEIKAQTEKTNSILRAEKNKWREIVSTLENDFKSKISNLEHQLQKQRDRSLQLLEEKENEIKTLKTSFEIFMPQQQHHQNKLNRSDSDADERMISDEESNLRASKTVALNTVLNAAAIANNNVSMNTGHISTENCHMLHYVHEMSRKDVEITNLRKAKHSAETVLRQALQDKVSAQEILNDRILTLEQEVDRLERCKTREGANLEYLKNVVLSFLSSNDVDGKKHMVNAIGAVLQFTPSEIKLINNLLYKK